MMYLNDTLAPPTNVVNSCLTVTYDVFKCPSMRTSIYV